jgi:hypothetical protein
MCYSLSRMMATSTPYFCKRGFRCYESRKFVCVDENLCAKRPSQGIRQFNDSSLFLLCRHVQVNNESAISFYQKFGFNVVETKPAYYKRIEPADAHVLQKTLRKSSSSNSNIANPTSSNVANGPSSNSNHHNSHNPHRHHNGRAN